MHRKRRIKLVVLVEEMATGRRETEGEGGEEEEEEEEEKRGTGGADVCLF